MKMQSLSQISLFGAFFLNIDDVSSAILKERVVCITVSTLIKALAVANGHTDLQVKFAWSYRSLVRSFQS